jgi:hypothetical protein
MRKEWGVDVYTPHQGWDARKTGDVAKIVEAIATRLSEPTDHANAD